MLKNVLNLGFFMNNSHFLTATTLAASFFTIASLPTDQAMALTINATFIPPGESFPTTGIVAGNPSENSAGGGDLISLFETAANFWESAIQDDHTIEIAFGWLDLSIFPGLGNPIAVGPTFSSSFPPNSGFVAFNNISSIPWFLDSSPQDNNEWSVFTETEADLGAGTINVGRIYSSPLGDAIGRRDLLSVAMHEIGHNLGFLSANPLFGVPGNPRLTFPNLNITEPRPFSGTIIPTTPDEGGHISANLPTAAMSIAVSSLNQRYYPSSTDILAIAEVSNFTQVNLNPTQKVPEPSGIIGMALALGIGVLSTRKAS